MRIIYRNSKNKNMNSRNKTNVIPINNNSNLQDLISAKKNPSTNKIIFLKKNKSNSFRNIHELKSPAKITTTHRHNFTFKNGIIEIAIIIILMNSIILRDI